MSTKMLIDAGHPEETRVTIVKGNRVEEFDYESANKAQLKGNIYLAKVTRVEPSLQAAFVDYGGNRHGFLAFSEIHPDYYQIPVEDREELLKAEKERHLENKDADAEAESKASDADTESKGDNEESARAEDAAEQDLIDETLRQRRMKALRRKYKIQEVIKKGQIMLVQVVKEERSNKGAALTTYLSIAGRYSVLMPNTTHGGGISRKISNIKDRRRLKSILEEMNIPDTMGCIIRTAGMSRTKAEIKRDVDYLLKLWEGIRELTLESIAPTKIYEEGNLIKRAIRDLYDRDIDEILVEGEEGYRTAKEFMRLLMPSHARKVQHYKDRFPLFNRYQVESQLESMFSPTVQLKSGGYLVINPTEALIAIDVNSGRSTKEHNIEETALKTNLEAADEMARQLRLRDMAGIIVIDFIDMEERVNNRKIERRMKEALKADRARIQVGRISSLGLMELSRQRLHPNIIETSTRTCPHCEGSGRIRTVEAASLRAIRAIEEEGVRNRSTHVTVKLPTDVAVYLLNKKRHTLADLEARYQIHIDIQPDHDLGPSDLELEYSKQAERDMTSATIIPISHGTGASQESDQEEKESSETPEPSDNRNDEEKPAKRKRRRGRRGGRRRRDNRNRPEAANENDSGQGESSKPKDDAGKSATAETSVKPSEKAEEKQKSNPEDKPVKKAAKPEKKTAEKKDTKKPASRKKSATSATKDKAGAGKADKDDGKAGKEAPKPEAKKTAPRKTGPAKKAPTTETKVDSKGASPKDKPADTGNEATKKSANQKKGWWQRTFS